MHKVIRDSSCHYYLCPSDKESEASQYLSDTEDYWASDDPIESDCPTRPDWLIDIDNLSELDILAPHEKAEIQSQASILINLVATLSDCTEDYMGGVEAVVTINTILQC